MPRWLLVSTLMVLATAASDAVASRMVAEFNAEDATACLQAAIDSGAPQVVVPYRGAPWIVRPIRLRSNLELIFEPGVVVLAKAGEFKGKGDSLFSAVDQSDITIRGYGATLRMRKADYQSKAYEKAEWRMTLDFAGCSRVTIEGIRLESSGGDGIYIGCTAKQPFCKDVVIRDVTCHDHHRQGISVIGAVNLLIENCTMSGTSGTAPEAGIDFEPNAPEERLENCIVRNCTFDDNAGAGILVYVKPLSRESAPISILFDNCHVRSGRDAGIGVGAVKDDGPKGAIEFKNCTIENTQGSGVYLYDKAADSARVIFTDCKWSNVATKSNGPPLLFHARRETLATTIGGISLDNCRLYDQKDRPAVVIEGKKGAQARDIQGRLTVVSTAAPHMETQIPAENVTLDVSAGE